MHIVDHSKNIIEIKNLSFSYGDQEILKDISFNIHQGDYLGLIGPNGGGKTTLLKILLKLLTPTSGSIKIFGEDIKNFKDWYKIGYVPQNAVKFDFNFPSTVAEVVAMGLFGKKGLFHNINQDDKNKVIEVLDSVGMLEYKDRLISDLSGGQQQRVFIARALVSNPVVLLLDEPTSSVDVGVQEDFHKLLHNLNSKYDLTLVLVSHDIEVIAQEATEIASINKTLIYHGTPEKFMSEDFLSQIYGKSIRFIHYENH